MSTQLRPRPTERRPVEAPERAIEHTTAPAERATMRRYRIWLIALMMVIAAVVGVVAVNMLISDPVATTTDYTPAFDSPGGNSLNIPQRATATTIPAFDSPGGNSLNVPSATTDGVLAPRAQVRQGHSVFRASDSRPDLTIGPQSRHRGRGGT